MTVKEIADAVGKNPATVARWVEKVSRKMQEVSRKVQEAKATSVAADYDLDETCAIIQEGMGANAAGIFRANADNANIPRDNVGDIDEAFKAAVVGIYGMLQQHEQRISAVEGAQRQRAALLPAPQKTARAELSQLVREYSRVKSVTPQEAWKKLYQEIYYRLHINALVRARNEGVKGIDILDREGMTEQACAIAAEMLQE